MGCSSSTLTHPQGSNRPPAKAVETNGPKKSASSEVSDQIIDDIETIPDQTKLVPLTENETSSNGFPPEDEQTEAVAAVELDEEGTTEPAAEDCPPAEEEPVQMEESTDLIMTQDSSVIEASSEVSDQIIDDIETIPDQTKLVPLTENETSSNGFPPEDEQTEAVAAVELDEEGTMEPAAEDCPPAEEEPVQMEESTDLIMTQDSSVIEGRFRRPAKTRSVYKTQIKCQSFKTQLV